MTDEAFEDIRTKTLAELSAGPMTLVELTNRLKGCDALPAEWDEDDVDELLLDVDECWMGESGLVALTEVLLDGVVLLLRQEHGVRDDLLDDEIHLGPVALVGEGPHVLQAHWAWRFSVG